MNYTGPIAAFFLGICLIVAYQVLSSIWMYDANVYWTSAALIYVSTFLAIVFRWFDFYWLSLFLIAMAIISPVVSLTVFFPDVFEFDGMDLGDLISIVVVVLAGFVCHSLLSYAVSRFKDFGR